MKILLFMLVSVLLHGCGGGAADAPAPVLQPVTTNDLLAASGTPSSSQSGTLCGVDVAANVLLGTVAAVHDGDTLTLNAAGISYKIRLASIDAPELAQAFGDSSRVALSNAVLGSTVQVAYAQTDQYGRIVGALFDNACQYVNLNQVATGMAWFYQAYQCEVSLVIRNQLAQAQSSAHSGQIGLWSQAAPVAPWVYRNGSDPAVPSCTSNAAVWPGNLAAAPASTSTATTPSAYTPVNGCFKVWVNAYVRSDGTHVNGYWRNSPGCA